MSHREMSKAEIRRKWLSRLAVGDPVKFYRTYHSKAFEQSKIERINSERIVLTNGHKFTRTAHGLAGLNRTGGATTARIVPI